MQSIADVAARFGALREQLDRVIIGQERVKGLAITSLIAGGHMLLEGAPGTGKTLLALALSRLVGCRFRRIQFTPDLMPADLLGANIFNQKTQEFAMRPGPVFTDILLADRCLKAGAEVIAPNGKRFTTSSIGSAVATRAIMADLRAGGDAIGGPPPFSKVDRSRFLSALDEALVRGGRR